MKKYLLLTALTILCSSIAFMGFQCGSAETTSAKLYIQRKDFASAEKSLIKEVEKNPSNAEAWYMLGDVRRELGDIKGMMAAFDASLKINNEFQKRISDAKLNIWGTRINLGVGKYNASKSVSGDSAKMFLTSAVSAYNDALMVNPDSAITYQNLAVAHIALGNTDSSIVYLKASLTRKSDPQFWTFLINAYVTKAEEAKTAGNKAESDKYFNEAISALTEARKSDPANVELLATLINVHIEAGRATEAMPYIKEAVEKDPTNKVFQNDLGLLLLQTNDLPGAIEHFDAAIAVDPAYTDALRNGSVALMRMGQKEKDAAMTKRDPKTGNVDKSYQKYFNKAAGYLEKYLAIKPDDANVWQALATAYGGADNTKKAAEALKKADALDKK
jgi:tetratricopeptide (TPR) repeat protein